jgi:hypothetical protein
MTKSPLTKRPLDKESLGQSIPWTTHDSGLYVPTLDRIEVLVVTSQFGLGSSNLTQIDRKQYTTVQSSLTYPTDRVSLSQRVGHIEQGSVAKGRNIPEFLFGNTPVGEEK